MKKIFSRLFTVLICFNLIQSAVAVNTEAWSGSIAEEFSGGKGTASNPYQISTASELALLASLVNSGVSGFDNAYYSLVADIDLNYTNWIPIGISTLSYEIGSTGVFSGTFCGNGHSIKNLSISSATTNRTGLFGTTNGATISDIVLENVFIELTSSHEYYYGTYCGSLIGYANETVINNCSAFGTIALSSTSSIYAGGLVGSQYNGAITNCSAAVSVSEYARDNTEVYMGYCGGLVGYSTAPISNCSATGDLSIFMHSTTSGGLVGYTSENVENCFATGSVSGECRFHRYGGFIELGGLIGTMSNSNTISYCYATGNISAKSGHGTAYAGGLVGRQVRETTYYHTIIKNCFSAGNVAAIGNGALKSFSGALIGDMNEEFTYDSTSRHFSNCYYNHEAIIALYLIEISSNEVGYATSINDFKSEPWIVDTLGYDTQTIWIVDSSYPSLRASYLNSGPSGSNSTTPTAQSAPMFRMYNPNSGEHFYTGSAEERDSLEIAGWIYEGIAWNAPTQTGEHVYRLFNPNSGDHHYTMSAEERDNLVAVGWIYEGVCWNSAAPDNLPQYRLYNPNADCGSHHYTGSEEERDMLVGVGWIFEGIGWFGMLK